MLEHRRQLWTLLAAVEAHTLERYRTHVPELATAAKRAAVGSIDGRLPAGSSLEGTPLAGAVSTLLAAADGQSASDARLDVLFIQGLVFEQLGVTLYRALQEGDRLTHEGQDLAASALRASEEVIQLATQALCSLQPDPSERFYAFTGRTEQVFHHLDTLGLALDEVFAGPLQLRFADLMGDFVADLLPICSGPLGFERRRVMVHLSTAMMA